MSQITFEYPLAFLVLLLFFICFKFCKPKATAIFFPNIAMLTKASKKASYLSTILKSLIAILLVVAIASPVIEDEVLIHKDKGYEISLILDASGSMKQNNKFGIVKGIVEDFVTKRESDKLGLTIFADFAYVAIPLTYDKQSIKRLLSRIDVGIAGTQRTALYESLFLSSNLFKSSEAKNKVAILLTDGIDNANSIPLEVAIKTAKKYGIKVYTVGVGTARDFNPAILKKIAEDTGAKYFFANSVERLKEVYETINKLEKSEIKVNKFVKKHYYFAYPLALALLLMSFYFYLVNRE